MFSSVLLMSATRWSLLCAGASDMCALTTWSIVKSWGSFSNALLILSISESCDSPLAAWSFISAQWMTSKSNFVERRRQRASYPVDLARLSIHLSASWSVRIVKRWPSRYDRERNTDPTIARRSGCVVLYGCLVSVGKRDQYPIGFVVSADCFSSRLQFICALHVSVSSVMYSLEYETDSTGGDTRAFFRVSMAWSSLLLRGVNVLSCMFFNRWPSLVELCTRFAGSWVRIF